MAELYDVFVSHAGEDKDTIAAPVYHELRRRGLDVFLDREELLVGGNAPNAMTQAMETTDTGLFILSPEFAAKKWTMKELFCFIRRLVEAEGQGSEPPILIPVFHRLSVSDCKDGDLHDLFGEIFLKHKFFKRMDEDGITIKNVQEALRKLSSFTGIENRGGSSQGAAARAGKMSFIMEICDKVCDAVQRKGGPFSQRKGGSANIRGGVDRYARTVFAPKNAKEVTLDFDGKNPDGSPATTAGLVLEHVLRAKDSTGARVVSVTGMAGVGKSCILRGIAWNDQVRHHFEEGIFVVSLGMDATISTMIAELLKVLHVSGAYTKAKMLRGENRLQIVVHELGIWLHGKRCLLLVDDLWKRNGLSAAIITELCNMFSDDSGSVLTFTTRFSDVAVVGDTGCTVKLEPRDAASKESEAILLGYAKFEKFQVDEEGVNEPFAELLAFCKGLPVWLAAVGRGVALMGMNMGSNKKRAWAEYCSMLRKTGRTGLGLSVEGYEGLEKTLEVNVAVIEELGRGEIDFELKYGLGEMHRALSVFPKQADVPGSALRRLWGLQNKYQTAIVLRALESGGLVEVNVGSDKDEVRMRLHDLLHDFATASAISRNECAEWHRRFLDGYSPDLEVISVDSLGGEHHGEVKGDDGSGSRTLQRLRCNLGTGNKSFGDCATRSDDDYDDCTTIRAWWNAEDDMYIYGNVCRHLAAGGNVAELIWLLLSAHWTLFRHRNGGISSWRKDFSLCETAVEKAEHINASDGEELLRGMKLVRDAVCECWSFVSRNKSELGFQLHGRLLDIEDSGCAVAVYKRSLDQLQSRPWLQPKRRCWAIPGEGQVRMELHVGMIVWHVALCDSMGRVVAAVGNKVIVVDASSGEIVTTFDGHTADVRGVDISADGVYVASGSDDCTVRVWNVKSGKAVCRPFRGHEYKVMCVAMSRDGRYVVSGSTDNTIRVWDIERGKEHCRPLKGHKDSVWGVAISGDGRYIVSGSPDRSVRIWELANGKQIHGPLRGHTDDVVSVGISVDGRYAVSGSDDCTVRVWDVKSGKEVCKPLCGHKRAVRCVGISGNGRYVVSGSKDKEVRVWDVESGKEACEPLLGHTDAVSGVVMSVDGRYVMSGSQDRTIRVWEVHSTKENCGVLRGHTAFVRTVGISADGKYVVSGSDDCTVAVRELQSGKEVCGPLKGHTDWVASVATSADGRYVASGSRDCTVRVWRMQDGRAVCAPLRGHKALVKVVEISRDGRYVVSGSLDCTVRVWAVGTGMAVCGPLRGHEALVTTVGISVNGRYVVSGSWDKTVRVWDTRTGKEIFHPLRGHKRAVWSVAISEDNRYVVSGSDDCTVRLWELRRARSVGAPRRHGSSVKRVVVSGNWVLSNDLAGNWIKWKLDEERGLISATRMGGSNANQEVDCIEREIHYAPKNVLLATLPSAVSAWEYDCWRRVLVTALVNGQVLCHRLITK